jgi:hypothetical protein
MTAGLMDCLGGWGSAKRLALSKPQTSTCGCLLTVVDWVVLAMHTLCMHKIR